MNYSDFSNLYPLSKTLRFELIPQGNTYKMLDESGLISQDKQLAEDYKKVKKLIDGYHKYIINEVLSEFCFNVEKLQQLFSIYTKQEKSEEELLLSEKIKLELKSQLIESFRNHSRFNNLFSSELIKQDLPGWLTDEADIALVAKFNRFTTYFTGYHQTRENIYNLSIIKRVVDENLERFFSNALIFNKIIASGIQLNVDSCILDNNGIASSFEVASFNKTLNQSGIDRYNLLLGGLSKENGEKIPGINEIINLHNQKHEDRKEKLPYLKSLYKQVLSDSESSSFTIGGFSLDDELLDSINSYYLSLSTPGTNAANIFIRMSDILQHISDFDINGIYINSKSIPNISNKIFGQWDYIINALDIYYDTNISLDQKIKTTKKYKSDKEKWVSQNHSIGTIEAALEKYKSQVEDLKDLLKHTKNPIVSYFANLGGSDKNPILVIMENYKEIEPLIQSGANPDLPLLQNKEATNQIKLFLDSIMDLFHFINPLLLKSEILSKDEVFYSEIQIINEHLRPIIGLYNQCRNYLTKKPYSIDKFKLNFENSTLLGGWDVNKEADNTSVILIKDGLYYLAIMDSKHNKIFKTAPTAIIDEDSFQKMNYKLLPGANKMLPKVFFSEKGKAIYKPSVELLENYKKGTHKKGDNFSLAHCHQLIDFFKTSIEKHEDWSQFNFKFSPTESYEDISAFYREVEAQGYKINFSDIPSSYIHYMVDVGNLYLFQIYSKDFSKYSKGNPNIHTMYWKALFSAENLTNVTYKLNGGAEIFYRPKTKSKKLITHEANMPIDNKNPLNPKKQSTFEYELIKNKRFTEDKFQLHVPITINPKANGRTKLNLEVRKYLRSNPDTHIIGIDRGERNLLYVSVINGFGEIIEQFSLNQIINDYNNQTYKVDYHSLLNSKEVARAKAREDWGSIENIKELKEGYLSQVVHKISQLMVKYKAIVVMEDLSSEFKNSRIKFEKQIYQKFEVQLIEKLNYLMFKKPEGEQPGLYNALQLTNKFDSFEKLGRQSGFVFYVPAWYTSNVDPITGFVDLLKPKYENVKLSISFFENFDSISFNAEKDWFEFKFDYNHFTDKADGTKTQWTVCTTNEPRFAFDKVANNGKGAQVEYRVTELLKFLFKKYNIDYSTSKDLIPMITNPVEPLPSDFYRTLTKLLSITLTLRHNNGKYDSSELDYILSPVADANGVFFDSRIAPKTLPQNSYANGAYNIARKGLWAIHQIYESEDLNKVKLAISNKEWLNFIQK